MGLQLTKFKATISIGTAPTSGMLGNDTDPNRLIIASVLPRAPGGLVVNGEPDKQMEPLKGSDPGPKKSAGTGIAVKWFSKEIPGGEVHKSTPGSIVYTQGSQLFTSEASPSDHRSEEHTS